MRAQIGLDELGIDPGVAGFFTRPDYADVLARLRAEAPVFAYTPGSWTVARYDDVRAVSRDPETFCSGQGVLMLDPVRDGATLPGSILHMDPPVHAEWRKVASRWFTPRAVAQLSERVHARTVEVLDRVEPGSEVDFVDAVAAPIPVLVIAELLGVGDADEQDFRRWSDACIEGAEDDTDHEAEGLEKMAAVGELMAFLGEHVSARRAEPGDDLLSLLVTAEVEGRALTDDEVVMYCLSILVAGNETTRHLLSGAAAALYEHPDQRALLRRDADAMDGAVEECLRWVTPIQLFCRTATTDARIGDVDIPAGDRVVLLYASANRDEAAFGDDADRFDVTRPPNPAHLAFGFGEHLCLGASLARLEGRIVLRQLLDRFGAYEVTGEPTWGRSTLVRGMASLPVLLG
ncbi:MAG: cytochrome P450 [Acidimicrobiales bacterium]|nr:cytochrome P450 [Acidimicrobiales bacterium]